MASTYIDGRIIGELVFCLDEFWSRPGRMCGGPKGQPISGKLTPTVGKVWLTLGNPIARGVLYVLSSHHVRRVFSRGYKWYQWNSTWMVNILHVFFQSIYQILFSITISIFRFKAIMGPYYYIPEPIDRPTLYMIMHEIVCTQTHPLSCQYDIWHMSPRLGVFQMHILFNKSRAS